MKPTRASDAGIPWAPDVPSDQLARLDYADPRWAAWLESQGYTGAEIQRILAPNGLPAELERTYTERAAGVEGIADLEISKPALRAAVAVGWLSQRAPESVLRLDPRPSPFVSPDDMGDRLRLDGRGTARDVIGGVTWHVSAERGPAAAAQVIGAAIYRELGVLAPAARIITVDGARAAAWPRPTGWTELTRELVTQLHLQVLHSEAAADAFLSASPDPRFSVRPVPHELTGTTCRSDLRAVAGYVDGHAVVGWPASPAPRPPSTGWWLDVPRSAWAAGRERVLALPFATLQRCVQLGAGDAAEQARVIGDLLTRRALFEGATAV